MSRHNWRSVAALALVMAILPAASVAAPKLGKPAPKFRVTTLKKEKLDLAALRGNVVIVNRWATWCVPCRAEFVLFEKYSLLRSKYGLTIIAIESGGANARGPMKKLAEMVSFPVVMEAQAHASAYPTLEGAVPTNYVIDRAGTIRYAKAGAFALEELDGVVRPLLNEPAPEPPRSEDAAKGETATK